ncbi:MAG: hypothetical protein AAF715_29160 [Myxococcota bacterium]
MTQSEPTDRGEVVPLEDVARAQAELAAGEPLASVLTQVGATAAQLDHSLAHWLDRIASDARRGVRTLGARYSKAFVTHRPELLADPTATAEMPAPDVAAPFVHVDATTAGVIPALMDQEVLPFVAGAPVDLPPTTAVAPRDEAGETAFVDVAALNLPATPFEPPSPPSRSSSADAPPPPPVAPPAATPSPIASPVVGPLPSPPPSAPAPAAPMPTSAAPGNVDETSLEVQISDLPALPFTPAPTNAPSERPAPQPVAPRPKAGGTSFMPAVTERRGPALPFVSPEALPPLERYVSLGVLLSRTDATEVDAVLEAHGLTRPGWDDLDRRYRTAMVTDQDLRRGFDALFAASSANGKDKPTSN